MESLPQPQNQSSPAKILLGKYEIGRRLGSGSFAKVHLARSIETDELVAIKMIEKKKTIESGMEPRIIREIDAMRRLRHHPNILKIHEVMATKSKIYLVMELASGGELFSKVLRRGRLPESTARRYFQQLASALRFSHQDGVAHRDVKPQNLLLDEQGNLKVSDFGLSALPEHLQNGLLHTACGTPAYTAPEVISRRGYDGAKADAWSCGVILFVLLVGDVPFDDSNIASMYRKIHRRDYRFPSWITKQAKSIIYQMLDPNPVTRMSIETVMKTTWFKKSLETSEFHRNIFDSEPEMKSSVKSITAFDLISLSSGLDLSGLFEVKKKKERRFTAKVSAVEVEEKAKMIGKKLGYAVKKKTKKEGEEEAKVVGLGRGRTAIVVEAVELTVDVVVVEVKVVEGEEDDSRWFDLITELEDIVLSWHNDTMSLCRNDQREALLELKTEFPIHSNVSGDVTTVSWNKSKDCCFWEGVTCDAILGEVISLTIVSLIGNTSLKPGSGLFKLQQLRELKLSNCNLQGEIPSSIGNLSHLTSLDLSRNQLVGEVPALIGNLTQLRTMSLSGNKLRGNIPTSFANLTKLSELYLAENQFTGGDIVLANLTNLSQIDLSSNHFKYSIFAYLSGLHKLEHFLGHDNSFVGPFPSSLLMISSLVKIDLSKNQLEGSIDFGNTSSSSHLGMLYVGNNNFDGLIPESIWKLRNLGKLDLSHNNFGGRVPRSISKLVNLKRLDLSHNNFRGKFPISISKIGDLDLSQNNFEGLVPRSISKLVNLYKLDLSYNKLEGQVPHCLWRSSELEAIRLSHNFFSSFGKSVGAINGSSLDELDLGSNLLQGPFPLWICNLRGLLLLDLSNNRFTGSIPQCLKNYTTLEQLNLRNNNFSGFIPDLFIEGSSLRSLDVSRNNLVGKLPKSIINSEWLEYLNVRGNKIKDTFPFWLGSQKTLMVLLLRSNAFYGPVYNPSAYIGFPSLRIIDISNNKFAGSLPQDYFANWTDMSNVWSGYTRPELNYVGGYSPVYDSMDLVYKGVDMKFGRIFLGFKALDFSENGFSGDIPGSIGLLSELRLLNLSGNAFTGNIPPSLANITKLEILDLSRNNLSGEIPQGHGKLSSLSNINLSHNHLEGLVPRSTQFGSQNCSSFAGNLGLYGLDEICGEIHVPSPTSQQPEEFLSEPEESVLNWIAAAIAFGPGVFCGLVIGHIFTSYKHEWFLAR